MRSPICRRGGSASRCGASTTPFRRCAPNSTQHGVHPDDFRALDDLKRFPFTAKSDLSDNYPFGLFAVPKDQLARVHASSGTTGKPTVVGYTRNDLSMWSDVVARTIRAAGGPQGHDRA